MDDRDDDLDHSFRFSCGFADSVPCFEALVSMDVLRRCTGDGAGPERERERERETAGGQWLAVVTSPRCFLRAVRAAVQTREMGAE